MRLSMGAQKIPRIKLRQDRKAIFDLCLRIESQPDITRERLVCANSGHSHSGTETGA
jgi:hypothetical protein